jgi:hypothetical protein
LVLCCLQACSCSPSQSTSVSKFTSLRIRSRKGRWNEMTPLQSGLARIIITITAQLRASHAREQIKRRVLRPPFPQTTKNKEVAVVAARGAAAKHTRMRACAPCAVLNLREGAVPSCQKHKT